MTLNEMAVKMELEKLESLAEQSQKIYDGIAGSRGSRDHKLVMAYQHHVQQLRYLKEYRAEIVKLLFDEHGRK